MSDRNVKDKFCLRREAADFLESIAGFRKPVTDGIELSESLSALGRWVARLTPLARARSWRWHKPGPIGTTGRLSTDPRPKGGPVRPELPLASRMPG